MSLKIKLNLRSIFIADDDADDRGFFAEALAEVEPDIQLTEFEDGLQLIDLLFQPEVVMPDILFLDINMPHYNGLQCLEMIKGKKNFLSAVPVVMLSTSNDPAAIKKAFDLGASCYAVKPSSFHDIKNFLKAVMDIDWSLRRPDAASFRLI